MYALATPFKLRQRVAPTWTCAFSRRAPRARDLSSTTRNNDKNKHQNETNTTNPRPHNNYHAAAGMGTGVTSAPSKVTSINEPRSSRNSEICSKVIGKDC